jgi:hypothetical protein
VCDHVEAAVSHWPCQHGVVDLSLWHAGHSMQPAAAVVGLVAELLHLLRHAGASRSGAVATTAHCNTISAHCCCQVRPAAAARPHLRSSAALQSFFSLERLPFTLGWRRGAGPTAPTDLQGSSHGGASASGLRSCILQQRCWQNPPVRAQRVYRPWCSMPLAYLIAAALARSMRQF